MFSVADLDESVARVRPSLSALAGARIFITGGTGFIGKWLVAALSHANDSEAAGIRMTVLTRNARRFIDSAPALARRPDMTLVEGDVRSCDFPAGGFTHVVHAAADTSARAAQQPLELVDSIVNGTRRVLDFAAASGAPRFLFLSSGAVYGDVSGVGAIDETYGGACSTMDPRSAYGEAKRFAEHLTTLYTERGSVEAVVARAFAFVGPGLPLDAHFAIGNFIADALAGREIVVHGDGTPTRSYLYAADLAAWLTTLLAFGRPGRAYNVGSNCAVSIAELAQLVATVVPESAGYVIRGAPSTGAGRSNYIPSIDRARRELALEAWTPLNEAVRRTAEWARARQPTALKS